MRCEEVECRHTIVGDGVEHDGYRFCTTTCKDRWVWKREGKKQDEKMKKFMPVGSEVTIVYFHPGKNSYTKEIAVTVLPGILDRGKKDRIASGMGAEPSGTHGRWVNVTDGYWIEFHTVPLGDPLRPSGNWKWQYFQKPAKLGLP